MIFVCLLDIPTHLKDILYKRDRLLCNLSVSEASRKRWTLLRRAAHDRGQQQQQKLFDKWPLNVMKKEQRECERKRNETRGK